MVEFAAVYKSLLKDASLYSLSTVLARGFSLITVPIFTRILSPTDYGALDLLSYLAILLPLVVGLALDQAVGRFYIEASDGSEKRRIASSVLLYNILALLGVVLVAMPFAGYLSQNWLGGHVSRTTVMLVFVFIWVRSVFYVACNQLKYMFAVRKVVFVNVGNTVVSTALSIWFIAGLHWGVFGIFAAMSISQSLFGALAVYFGRAAYGFCFDWATWKRMIGYSLPLMPSAVAFFGMQYVDRYALNELRGLYDVGIYGIGARLASLVYLFLTGFQGAWSPLVMKEYRAPGAKKKFRTVFNYFVFVTAAILVVISLFGRDILLLVTTRVFSEGYLVVPLLTASAVLASVGNYFTFGIQIAERTHVRMVINILGLLINVVLNIVFIRWIGLIGAALATFTSYVLIAIPSMIMSQRYYRVPYEWGRVFAVFLIAMALSNLPLLHPFQPSVTVVALKILIIGIAVVTMARLLRISGFSRVFAYLRGRPQSPLGVD